MQIVISRTFEVSYVVCTVVSTPVKIIMRLIYHKDKYKASTKKHLLAYFVFTKFSTICLIKPLYHAPYHLMRIIFTAL